MSWTSSNYSVDCGNESESIHIIIYQRNTHHNAFFSMGAKMKCQRNTNPNLSVHKGNHCEGSKGNSRLGGMGHREAHNAVTLRCDSCSNFRLPPAMMKRMSPQWQVKYAWMSKLAKSRCPSSRVSLRQLNFERKSEFFSTSRDNGYPHRENNTNKEHNIQISNVYLVRWGQQSDERTDVHPD